MKRKNKKALDLYIHIHTTVLSAQKRGGGLSRSTLGSLHTSREASFMGVFFCLSPSKSSLHARGRRLLFSPSFVVLVNCTCVVLYARVIKEGREEKTRVVVVIMWQLGAVSVFSTPPPSRMMMMMMMMVMGGVRALFLCLPKGGGTEVRSKIRV